MKRKGVTPKKSRPYIVVVAAALVASACSGATSSDSPLPSESVTTTFTSTIRETTTTGPATNAAPEQNDFVPLETIELDDEAVVLSAEWFDVIRYRPGAVLDGPILDISNDGSKFLFGGGTSTPLVLDIDTGEVVRLAQGTTPARLSGNGRYVLHALDGDCVFNQTDCGSVDHERALVDLATGETQDLGGILGPVLVNEPGSIVIGLVHPTQSPDLNETVEWSNGATTSVRTLWAELGEFPESTTASPRLLGLEGSGSRVLYRPWVETGAPRGPQYSLLTAQGSVGLINDEMFSLGNRGQARLSDDGEVVLIGTDHGLMTVPTAGGDWQHYVLESPSRDIFTYASGGDRLVAVTKPDFESDGPTNLISSDRRDGPFDQSAKLLATVADSFASESAFSPRLGLEVSADGTAAALSIAVDDLDHPDGSSWVSFIINLKDMPEGAYIEVNDEGVIAERGMSPEPSEESGQATAQYLATTFDINADLVEHQLLLTLADADAGDLADLWRDAKGHAVALSAPPSLADAHERWVALLETFANELDALGSVFGSATDDAELQRAIDTFDVATGSLAVEEAEVDRAQLVATVDVLPTIEGPSATYLAIVLGVQQSTDASIDIALSALGDQAANPDAALRQIIDALTSLNTQLEALDEAEVPAAAERIHNQRRDALRAMTIMLDQITADNQSDPSAAEFWAGAFANAVREAQETNAAWSRYIAAVLREEI